jgi:hypothetical protein
MERLGDHGLELADMAEVEGPEERPERGRRHDPVAEHGSGGARAPHVRVVDVARTGADRVHERRDPSSRKGRHVDHLLGELDEAELLAQHADECEPRVGHGVVVVEHHRQTRSVARDWH